MKSKVVVFLDFESFFEEAVKPACMKLGYCFGYKKYPEDIVDFCKQLLNYKDEEISKIYFYKETPPKSDPDFIPINTFLRKLELFDSIVIRETNPFPTPFREQKEDVKSRCSELEIKIAVDIVENSLKGYTDTIIFLGYKPNISVALRLARDNGTRVDLVNFTDINIPISDRLKRDSTSIREFKILDFYANLHTKKKDPSSEC